MVRARGGRASSIWRRSMRAYRDDGWGRAALDPAMMVALFVYAYAIGVRSSRGDRAALPRGCRLPGDHRQPGARSRDDRALPRPSRAAIGELFGEVLALCARSRSGQVGVVAVDGTKIAAAATHHATRSYEQIAREILEEAAELDAAEDELLRRCARRRAAGGAAHERRSPQGAARGQAGARRRTRRAGQTGRRATAASGCGVPAPAASRTRSSSAASSPSTPPGSRPGSPATGRGG